MSIDEQRLNQFLGRAVGDLGAAISATLMLVGDQLGLYRALAKQPMGAAELARQTGTHERYVREWLGNQAAGGYVQYDAASDTYCLSEEQALCLADPGGPVDLPGAYSIVEATFHALEKTKDNFRTGKGMEWGEHHARLFHGTERFFRAGYNAHLITEWLPALDGTLEILREGGKVADVGCGHGASTVLMAQAYPRSTFAGSDYHDGSVAAASKRAAEAGVGDRVSFEVAGAQSFSGTGYTLVTTFDCLHDMGDPVAAARHIRSALAADGSWLIVEPMAADTIEGNLNPVGRSTTTSRRCCACRTHGRRVPLTAPAGRCSGRRRGRRRSARSCFPLGSRPSGKRPKHRSTWFMRPSPERLGT